MDLAFTPDELKFRDEIRAWVKANLPPDVAARRLSGARVPDKFEAQPAAFFDAVRAGYARRGAESPGRFAHIDADQPREAVWADVHAAVQGRGWL